MTCEAKEEVYDSDTDPLLMALAVNIVQGCSPINEMCLELQPKETMHGKAVLAAKDILSTEHYPQAC